MLLALGCSFDPPLVRSGADAPADGASFADGADGPIVIDAGLFDARPPDARVDAPPCPGDYPGGYRFVAVGATWTAAEADCENDGVGTHLMVLDTSAEGTELVDSLSTASRTWFGSSDRRIESNWRWVTGGTAPNLGSTEASDCGYYYIHSAGIPGQQQEDCVNVYPYLCECDHIAADPSAY
jgi:hypothetical protein